MKAPPAALSALEARSEAATVALGLAAGVAAHLAALAEAGGAEAPASGAARLDPLPPAEARARLAAALTARSLPEADP